VNEQQRRSIEASLSAARNSLRRSMLMTDEHARIEELLRGLLVLAINVTETLLC
jgi:hypothetical protein